jgi:hypothetical protein
MEGLSATVAETYDPAPDSYGKPFLAACEVCRILPPVDPVFRGIFCWRRRSEQY